MTNGAFVQTLVVTDIASGWTELAPLLVREQTLLIDVLGEIRRRLPFPLLGFDVDNDTRRFEGEKVPSERWRDGRAAKFLPVEYQISRLPVRAPLPLDYHAPFFGFTQHRAGSCNGTHFPIGDR